MKALTSLAVVLVLAFAQAAAAQQPSSLQGRVVRWGTSEPIPRVSVELRSVAAGSTAPFVAKTDSDGLFTFSDVPGGVYRIVATRPGYVNAEYGQRWPGGVGSPLTVPSGRAVSNVPIPMLQTGTVSGTVRDARGRPLGNAEVKAYKASFSTGRRVLTSVQTVTTDDRGEYRLFWLMPGRYFVAALHSDLSNSPMRAGGVTIGGGGPGGTRYQQFRTTGDNAAVSAPPILPSPEGAPAPRRKYMAVYYPGTTDNTQAAPLEVAPGAELRAIDFVVTPTTLQRIRGKVVYEANNEPAMSARVQWVSSTGASEGPDERSVFGPVAGAVAVQCCDGAFELGLPSGSYTLVAAVNNLYGRATVEVGDDDVDDIVLPVGRSFELKGRVTFEDRMPTTEELNAFRINLVSEPPVPGLMPAGYSGVLPTGSMTIQAGAGNFRMSILPVLPQPGAFLFPPINAPRTMKNLYVKSIRLGAADVLNDGLHLAGATDEQLDIVIGVATGVLSGTVTSAAREPLGNVTVVLAPDRAHRNRVDLMKSTSTDASGRYRFDDVPPGEYVALALDGVDDGEWQDPDFLAARELRGMAVRIEAARPLSANLVAVSP
ncbi:MAG TPA: carboxypeptidase-like regulatory domain-containing protein [Vicinamibacterales bacterium]|nr:carboxypeptidase-like regulatory domain-containing protein [Vicinamibacterales bacterium]